MAVCCPNVTLGGLSDIIIADKERGGFQLYPTNYTITHARDDYSKISIEGIIGDSFNAIVSRQEQLRGFSLLELMDEVGRRIKSGENKKERMKP